jgi:Fe-S-cluster containining protein
VVPAIDDLELQKLPGHPCPNLLGGGGCGIYDRRPGTCQTFHCGWRRLKWVGEQLRPDKSGVLVKIVQEAGANVVEFALLTRAALNAEGLAEAVAAAVRAEVPTYLLVPGPPGLSATRLALNEALRLPVLKRDKAAILDVLRAGRARGRAAENRPVILSGHRMRERQPDLGADQPLDGAGPPCPAVKSTS